MTPTWYERRILLGCMTLAAAVTAGTLLLADFAQEPDQDLTLNMAAAAPAPAHQQAVNQPALVSDAPESADLERVKLSQQSFQRGGMGSRALMTFTVRNQGSRTALRIQKPRRPLYHRTPQTRGRHRADEEPQGISDDAGRPRQRPRRQGQMLPRHRQPRVSVR
jgi:hypothetical protein